MQGIAFGTLYITKADEFLKEAIEHSESEGEGEDENEGETDWTNLESVDAGV